MEAHHGCEEDSSRIDCIYVSGTAGNSTRCLFRHQECADGSDLWIPREDCLKLVLFLRQQGLLTNKINDLELANLIEILTEPLLVRYQLLTKDTGGFTIEMEELSDDESKKLVEELTNKESKK